MIRLIDAGYKLFFKTLAWYHLRKNPHFRYVRWRDIRVLLVDEETLVQIRKDEWLTSKLVDSEYRPVKPPKPGAPPQGWTGGVSEADFIPPSKP